MTDWTGAEIARMVGSRHPKVYLTLVKGEMSRTSWWDEAIVDRITTALFDPREAAYCGLAGVVEALDPVEAPELPREQEPQRAPLPSPPEPLMDPPARRFFSERQRKAYEQLQQALCNTMELQKGRR